MCNPKVLKSAVALRSPEFWIVLLWVVAPLSAAVLVAFSSAKVARWKWWTAWGVVALVVLAVLVGTLALTALGAAMRSDGFVT